MNTPQLYWGMVKMSNGKKIRLVAETQFSLFSKYQKLGPRAISMSCGVKNHKLVDKSANEE